MNLDDQLRSVLNQEAAMRTATPPDMNSLISGGQARRRRRNAGLAAAGVLAIALVGGGIVGAVQLGGDNSSAPPVANSPSDDSKAIPAGEGYLLDLSSRDRTRLPALDDPSLEGGFRATYSLDASPDGSRLLWQTGCCDGEDVTGMANLDGTGATSLDPAGSVNWYGPRWSHDGTRLVFQQRDGDSEEFGDIVVRDVATGKDTVVRSFPTGHVGYWWLAPVFSADDRHVIYQMPRGQEGREELDIMAVPVDGGSSTVLVRDAERPMTSSGPEWAYVQEGKLVVVEADGTRRVLVAGRDIGDFTFSPDRTKIAMESNGSDLYLVDVATGRLEPVGIGSWPSWVDADTLLVAPAR